MIGTMRHCNLELDFDSIRLVVIPLIDVFEIKKKGGKYKKKRRWETIQTNSG